MLVLFEEQRRAWQGDHLGSSCAHKDGTAGAAAAGAGAGEACVGAAGRVTLLAKGAAGGRSAVAQLSRVLLVLLHKSNTISCLELIIVKFVTRHPKMFQGTAREPGSTRAFLASLGD